ncbi:MAG: hypothetical protein JNM52_07420 [Betaproteobacteria bacterium]|nr:hypothetical protein [Betaproteobacteria bacterium]
MGLLDDLKKEADALKNQESERTQALKANAAAVDRALRKTFHYLNDLFKQLNVVKPPCARSYDLLTVGKIEGLIQTDYRVEYRTSERNNAEHFETLDITFKRTKPEQLTVKREAEQIERFRNLLWQNNMRFTSEVMRNERRVVTHEIFTINCEVLCGVDVIGDYDNGVVRFKLKNIEDFGPTIYSLEPDSVTDKSLEEFAKLLIGKESGFKEFNRRPANSGSPPSVSRTSTKIPQYVVEPTPPVEEEKKTGLLSSIKSVLKKPIL